MIRSPTLCSLAWLLVTPMVFPGETSRAESPSQVSTAGARYELPATEEGLPGEGPLRRYEGYVNGWRTRRARWSQRQEADRGAVVFLGDSITQGWGDDFATRFPGMKAANRGIGGDTTRGMLIRLEEDVLALDPAAIVILAGTNDVEIGIEPEAITRNLGRIIESVKRHDKQSGRATPIILCRVFPSSAAKKRPAETIRRLNTLIENSVRGDAQVTLLDTWTLFADANGDASPAFFPDLLHLNPAGYDMWAAALRPVLATLGFVDPAAATVARPNVILFIADDVSWDDVGCYASGERNMAARTPRIDQLAATGRRFDAAILTASSCSPSRSSIITGRYPHNCGRASELHQPIAAHLPWFPRLMREAGYFTALVGKNHMTVDQPQPGESAPPAAFDVVKKGFVPGNRGGHAEWVQTVRERPRDKPFFFWFAALDAHRDWDGDADWREDLYGLQHEHTAGDVPPFLVDDPATRADLASYRNEVTRFDYFVGQVVDELARQEILDNTLLIVMADNGRPFPRAKTRLHDSGMKTPFVVHWPQGLGQPGIPTKSLVSAIDIAPTVLAAAGIEAADTMQGVSFLPILVDPEAEVRRVAFSEHNWHDYEAHGRAARTSDGWLYIRNRRPLLAWQGPADSVRSPAHRSLIAARNAGSLSAAQADVFRAPRPDEELYFTPDDPAQLNNLEADSAHAADLERMRKLLADWTEQTRDSDPADLSSDEHDRETGLLLPKSRESRNWFRGTPAGWDRDAAHALEAGPR
ncbi:MAG: sulfatase-like hydrolase/transferase [Planctomycetota bacterium]|nr:sulfatase-like hydrolase/transferase [Planctomycetota bacterium]